MDAPAPGFEFEQPIFELRLRIAELLKREGTPELQDEIRQLRREAADLTKQI